MWFVGRTLPRKPDAGKLPVRFDEGGLNLRNHGSSAAKRLSPLLYILSCVSYLFLAQFHQAHKKKSSPDDLPGADRHSQPGRSLDTRRPMHPSPGPEYLPDAGSDATPQRRRRTQPPQADTSAIARAGAEIKGHDSLRLESLIAL